MGIYTHDSGKVIVNGKEMTAGKTTEALSSGVYMVPQEPLLFPNMTVEENILIGFTKPQSELHKELVDTMKKIGWNLELNRKANTLSIAEQQLVELLRGLLRHAKILILDEPTSALTFKEVESLFKVVKDLKAQGIGIIYITHRLDEVFELTDRVSILRDGEYITTLKTAETNRAELIRYMVGREMTATFPPRNTKIGDVALELRNLTGNGVKNISFKARRGEILGISGLVGAGRTEIMKVVFGAEKAQWGEIYVNGKKADIRSPKDAMHKYGICLIPEDRKREGCFLGETISWNLVYNVVEKISHAGVVDRKKEAEIANYYGEAMRIKAPNLDATKVGTLSGGNQQKVVVGKALATQSDIVIFDEPTRGIDVGAKYEIYELMNGLCEEGKCVVMVTSDMEELLGMSDRIVVFGEKCLAGELTKEEFSQERILDMASTSDRENETMGA